MGADPKVAKLVVGQKWTRSYVPTCRSPVLQFPAKGGSGAAQFTRNYAEVVAALWEVGAPRRFAPSTANFFAH